MKNLIILMVLILGMSSCFTYQKIKSKPDNLAKLDKIFQRLEFKVSTHCVSGSDFPFSRIAFQYEADSIFLHNRNTFYSHYKNRITPIQLDSLKKQIIQSFSKKAIKRIFQKKIPMKYIYGLVNMVLW